MYPNLSAVDFSSIQDEKPAKRFKLSTPRTDLTHVESFPPLMFMKVSQFTLFIEDNAGDFDTTFVDYIQFIGKKSNR